MNPLVHLDGKLPCIPISYKLNTLHVLNLSSYILLKKLFVLLFVCSYLNSVYGNNFFQKQWGTVYASWNVSCVCGAAALSTAISDDTGWAGFDLSSADGVILSFISWDVVSFFLWYLAASSDISES